MVQEERSSLGPQGTGSSSGLERVERRVELDGEGRRLLIRDGPASRPRWRSWLYDGEGRPVQEVAHSEVGVSCVVRHFSEGGLLLEAMEVVASQCPSAPAAVSIAGCWRPRTTA